MSDKYIKAIITVQEEKTPILDLKFNNPTDELKEQILKWLIVEKEYILGSCNDDIKRKIQNFENSHYMEFNDKKINWGKNYEEEKK